jgi:uncharacterized DUF497 family protein
MKINYIVCPIRIVNKLASKHNIKAKETREVILNKPRIRFAEKGNIKNNDVYGAFGQTKNGRYLSVFFIYKPENKTAIIISAHDMSNKERKAYGKKKFK